MPFSNFFVRLELQYVCICGRYRQGLCKVREVGGRGRGVQTVEDRERERERGGNKANHSEGKEPCKWMLSSAGSGYTK